MGVPTDILNQTRELSEAEEWQLSGLSVGVKMRKELPQNDLWVLLSNRVKPNEIYLRPTRFFRKVYSRNVANWDERARDSTK